MHFFSALVDRRCALPLQDLAQPTAVTMRATSGVITVLQTSARLHMYRHAAAAGLQPRSTRTYSSCSYSPSEERVQTGSSVRVLWQDATRRGIALDVGEISVVRSQTSSLVLGTLLSDDDDDGV